MRMTLEQLARKVHALPDGPVEVVDRRNDSTHADARELLQVLKNGIMVVFPPVDSPVATAGKPVYFRFDDVESVRLMQEASV